MKCDFCHQDVQNAVLWTAERHDGRGLQEQFMCGKCLTLFVQAKAEVMAAE